MSEMIELKKSVPVVTDVDVLIVGAGISGATAAVAAGRSGAKTMVVDRFGYLGGNMGPGMIGGAPYTEIPKAMGGLLPGIPGELIKRCEKYCNAPLLSNYFRDSQVISYVWTQMMQEASVQFMYNTYAGDPIMEGNRVTGLFVENKNGTQAIRAKVVVDATSDADVAARAGATMDGGKSLFNPGVYFAMANVDIERYMNEVFAKSPSSEDRRWAENILAGSDSGENHTGPHLPNLASRLNIPTLTPLVPYYRAAWEAGEYEFFQEIDGLGCILLDHGIFRTVSGWQYVEDPLRIGKYGILGALAGIWRIENPTSGDTQVMTALEVKSRNFIFETAQFLIRRVPGFEKAYLHIIAPYFNSRGGRSIVSEHPVTVEDVEAERKFDDVVFQMIRQNLYCDFPYRQFLPRGVDGLLVTGRACIVQPPVMRVRWMVLLMGQAAGVAAALAARKGITPRALNVKELQKLLYHKHQARLGDEERLRELGII